MKSNKMNAEFAPAKSGQPTPTPWYIASAVPGNVLKVCVGQGRVICEVMGLEHVGGGKYLPSAEAKGNAELIALAVNSHAALVEALRKCKAAVEDSSKPPSARMELVRDYATPALGVATGKGEL